LLCYTFGMKQKQRKAGEADNPVLKEIPKACIDETAAVEFMEKQRWGKTPACPRCGDTDVVQVKDSDGNRNKRYLWRCHGCKKQFTVRIGTVFEDSRIPLRIWCYAFWKACSSKKGISALQISRECNLSYKSALFLMHRIRYAMAEPNKGKKVSGTVEVDETYVGGKPRRTQRNIAKGVNFKSGRGTKKTPVLGMVGRKGQVRVRVIPNVTTKTLRKHMLENIDVETSRLMTDEWRAYRKIGKLFAGGHGVVRHSLKEYARGDIYSNTAESFFALIKRGVYGTFHSVSKKYLHLYLNEFAFRWNTRKINDGERISAVIRCSEGKRLMYYEPVRKPA